MVIKKKLVKMSLEGLNFDFTVYSQIKRGLSPKQIADKYKMSKQRIDYYIQRLKRNGYIEKIGRGVWKTLKNYEKVSQNEPKDTPSFSQNLVKMSLDKLPPDTVRGHAFTFVLRLPDIKNWDKREEYLLRRNVPFKKVGFGGLVQSFVFKGFRIWLGAKSVTVYFPKWKHYFSDKAVDGQNFAIYDFRELVKSLESFLSCSFKINRDYKFKVSKQHYALIKNSLAIQYNRDGQKLQVRNDDGELWFLIDDSLNLDEAETVHSRSAIPDNDKVKAFFNEVKSGASFEGVVDKFNQQDKVNDLILGKFKDNSRIIYEINNNIKMILEYIAKKER